MCYTSHLSQFESIGTCLIDRAISVLTIGRCRHQYGFSYSQPILYSFKLVHCISISYFQPTFLMSIWSKYKMQPIDNVHHLLSQLTVLYRLSFEMYFVDTISLTSQLIQNCFVKIISLNIYCRFLFCRELGLALLPNSLTQDLHFNHYKKNVSGYIAGVFIILMRISLT